MAFQHELVNIGDGYMGIRHMRVAATTPSGLLGVTEIAKSFTWGDRSSKRQVYSERLMVVTALTSNRRPFAVFDSSIEAFQTVEAADLAAFAETGVESWQRIITGMGQVASLTLILREHGNQFGFVTSSGAIITSREAPEFTDYVAKPEEIAALDQMVTRVNSTIVPVDTAVPHGQYM